MTTVMGLDIGGANLKAATSAGHCVTRPFPIWKSPDLLADALRQVQSSLPECDVLAVTMTAELADCYPTKRDGVRQILAAVSEVAGVRPVQVWLTSGRFAAVDEALQNPLLAAASNWQAQATWACRFLSGEPALLIDTGSTTTDVIPLEGRCPAAQGVTDLARLAAGELVYTGARRTPLCALARDVSVDGRSVPLAAEWFATSLDLYLWDGSIADAHEDFETANGRPATRFYAHDRLARQFCGDREEIPGDVLDVVVPQLRSLQEQQISRAVSQVLASRDVRRTVLISGSGSFLARRVVSQHPSLQAARLIDLETLLDPSTAAAACAYAIAVLAAEHPA